MRLAQPVARKSKKEKSAEMQLFQHRMQKYHREVVVFNISVFLCSSYPITSNYSIDH